MRSLHIKALNCPVDKMINPLNVLIPILESLGIELFSMHERVLIVPRGCKIASPSLYSDLYIENNFREPQWLVTFNPINAGGIWTLPISGVCAILHTTTNFWTTGDTKLKFYMVIDIYKLFSKIERKLGWNC